MEKRVKKVVSKDATIHKKSGINKAIDVFIQEDWSKIKDYAVNDVIKPGIRDVVWNLVTNTLGTILYKDAGGIRKTTTPSGLIRSYSSMYNNAKTVIHDNRQTSNGMKRVYDYGNVELDSRQDAEAVIFELVDAINRYSVARVADLYDAAGYTCVDGQNQKYGWTDLSNARVKPTNNGKWTIVLPRPLPIDDGR